MQVYEEPAAVGEAEAALSAATTALTQATEGVVAEDEEEPSGGLTAAQAALEKFEPQLEGASLSLSLFFSLSLSLSLFLSL